MDTDQIKGKLQNAFGKVEQAVGEAVGSNHLSNAGTEDRIKGAGTETWGNVKDTASTIGHTADHNTAVASREDAVASREDTVVGTNAHGESLRDRIATGVENLKERVNGHLDETKEEARADRY